MNPFDKAIADLERLVSREKSKSGESDPIIVLPGAARTGLEAVVIETSKGFRVFLRDVKRHDLVDKESAMFFPDKTPARAIARAKRLVAMTEQRPYDPYELQ